VDLDELIALDRVYVWHPYGPMPGTADALVVTEALGRPAHARRRAETFIGRFLAGDQKDFAVGLSQAR
jgi:hypothetical protein